MPRDICPLIPRSVLVRFPGVPEAAGACTAPWPPRHYAKDVTAIAAGFAPFGTHEGKHFVHSSAAARFAAARGAGDPTNQAELDALAARIAGDYYGWRVVHFDIVYIGIVAWEMEGLTDSVEWTYADGACTTRAMTSPYNVEPEELLHAATDDGDDDGPFRFYTRPVSRDGDYLVLPWERRTLVDGRYVLCDAGEDRVFVCCGPEASSAAGDGSSASA